MAMTATAGTDGYRAMRTTSDTRLVDIEMRDTMTVATTVDTNKHTNDGDSGDHMCKWMCE